MIIAQVAAKIVAELMVADKVQFNGVADMQVAMNDWFTAIINVGSGNVAPPQQQNQVPAQYPDQQSQAQGQYGESQVPGESDIPF